MDEEWIYRCEVCNYRCSKKYDYNRHLMTKKHNERKKRLEKKNNNIQIQEFICSCGKDYKHRQSLYAHKKKCNYYKNIECININNNINKDEEKYKHADIGRGRDRDRYRDGDINSDIDIDKNQNDNDFKNLVINLIKENNAIRDTLVDENRELRRQLKDIIPKIGDINSNNTIKQKFNIQFFLNNQCKDAINLDDFIKSIKISIEQLDITHNRGLIDGLSEAIIQNMRKLGIFERPMHCTDVKRETLYIKDNDVWERDIDKSRIKHAIKSISVKQYGALKTWMNINPDFHDIDSKQDYFATILSTIGKNTESENIDEKIIKKICSNVYIKD